ncbi:MAG TPA: hypothetical protein PKA62_05915 [Thermoanaerobaculia bacterium]|nr:hypothetical protein [Thermoanaerobaculia bacterium]
MRTTPLADHFLHLVLLATILSAFFSILWRDDEPSRRHFFARMWTAIVGGSLAAAWAMSVVGGR